MTQSHSEVTVIDRQKYVAELGKLLSGMAPQDREAVLRGINARFDAEGDDAAVIAALGSPTFAAVTVLRGYTPPEEGELGSRYEPEPEPVQEPEPEPVQEHEPAAEAEPAPEAEAEPEAQAGPGPEPQAGPEQEAEPESPQAPEAEAPQEPEAEVEAAPEPEPAPGAQAEPEPEAEPEAEAEPETETEAGAEAEPEVEAESEAEAEYADTAADEPAGEDAAPELPPFWDGPPELPKPPKAKVGLLILYILFGLVICLPVTVALTGLALGIFVLGGAGIGLGALLASFCFLGMNVVADILLLAGAALVAAALGLLLLFFAVWFFLRGVVGFADLIIRKGRDWCYEHGEVDA